MKKLTNEELKQINGGLSELVACCEVQCPDGSWNSRDCQAGVSCSSSGTSVACGDEKEGVNLCNA